MKLEKYIACSRAAQKLDKAELVLKNAKIVNVFTDRVEDGNIAITKGMIVGIGDVEGIEEQTDDCRRSGCSHFSEPCAHCRAGMCFKLSGLQFRSCGSWRVYPGSY